MLTPVLTALLCVSIAYWLYQGCDEYIRLRLLRCVAVTAIIVAFATLAYFFLELGWSVFNAQMLFVILRSR